MPWTVTFTAAFTVESLEDFNVEKFLMWLKEVKPKLEASISPHFKLDHYDELKDMKMLAPTALDLERYKHLYAQTSGTKLLFQVTMTHAGHRTGSAITQALRTYFLKGLTHICVGMSPNSQAAVDALGKNAFVCYSWSINT